MQKLVLLILLLASFCSFGQLKVNCTQVNADGSTTINWAYTGSQATFADYKIYRKTSLTGVSTLLTTISNYTTNSYTDVASEATSKSCLYVVEATLTTLAVEKDSMSTIFLTASTTGVGNNEILLSYKSLLSLSGTYKIYQTTKTGSGIWTDALIGTSTTDTYTDKRVQPKCEFIYYKVELPSTCSNISNKAEIRLQDDEKPDMPLFDSVSIDLALQKIKLGWQPSLANDVQGYLVLKSESINGSFLPIDTAWGRNTTHYIWTNGSINEVHYFKIAAIDKCSEPNTSLITEAQVNMVLRATAKNCSNTIQLSWNEYINMPSGLEKYKLYLKIDNGGYTPVAEIDKSQTETSYTVPAGTINACFFVQAVGLDGTHTASSKTACINFGNPEIAKYVYIRSASVNPANDGVTINLYVDGSYTTAGYDLYRYMDGKTPAKVAQIPYTGANNVSYIDNRIYPDKQPYNYYVSVNDACNLISKTSNTVKIICLKLVNEDKSTNKLSWNSYVGWQQIAGYEVYKQEGDGTPKLLVFLNASDSIFTDDKDIATATAKLNYSVVAIEGSTNAYGFKDQARSSTATYSQKGEIFIPSAFMPKAMVNNSIFLPILYFVDEKNYHLQVFDRWGLLVFETKDPNQGWDGKYKGDYAPVGAYIYSIDCKLSSGEKFSKRGTVNLLE